MESMMSVNEVRVAVGLNMCIPSRTEKIKDGSCEKMVPHIVDDIPRSITSPSIDIYSLNSKPNCRGGCYERHVNKSILRGTNRISTVVSRAEG